MICDIAILVVFAIFLVSGYKKGFIRSAYSMLSVIISIVLLYFFRDAFTEYIVSSSVGEGIYEHFSANYDGDIAEKCAYALTYILSVAILYIALRFAVKSLFKVLNIIAKLPLLNILNSLIGAAFGAVGGFLWIVIVLNVLYIFPQTKDLVSDSEIAKAFNLFAINFLGK